MRPIRHLIGADDGILSMLMLGLIGYKPELLILEENFIHLAAMISDPESALKVAEFLLKIRAVRLNPDEPFEWASGWKSPIYCDNRLILSYPQVRTYVRQEFVKSIQSSYNSLDVVVGVATGGIAIGALIAEEMGLPFAYVRSKAKGHGMQNMIEGNVPQGAKVIVIEDLVSTGGSSLKAVKALREAGAEVLGMMAIFTYGFHIATSAFQEADVRLGTLSDYDHLITVASNNGFISEDAVPELKAWRAAPSEWKQDQ